MVDRAKIPVIGQEYLSSFPSPVNYTRRRHLDYRHLLPDKEWAGICRRVQSPGSGPKRARAARRWLFERISGSPADHAPASFAISAPAERARLADLATFLTPALRSALDEHGLAYLRDQGITSEPLTCGILPSPS